MAALMRHSLLLVWAILVAVTLASWWISRSTATPFQLDHLITFSVLAISAIKARLVIWHFMEVRHAPSWLKWTCDGWLACVLLMLLGIYWWGS